ncbi:hypothetical protein ACNQR7_32490 [Mycolicibacterium senegalense]|uniref:hypothetical protein n=1 Tax=Mycolicibacterium senegalense TaxID=1796 RepID=UPI003AB0B6AB
MAAWARSAGNLGTGRKARHRDASPRHRARPQDSSHPGAAGLRHRGRRLAGHRSVGSLRRRSGGAARRRSGRARLAIIHLRQGILSGWRPDRRDILRPGSSGMHRRRQAQEPGSG